MIKIWGSSGTEFMIETDAESPGVFLSQVAEAFGKAAQEDLRDGDWEYGFSHWLPLVTEIWAKLKGYKTELVREQHLLTAGQLDGEARKQEPVITADGQHGALLNTLKTWHGWETGAPGEPEALKPGIDEASY